MYCADQLNQPPTADVADRMLWNNWAGDAFNNREQFNFLADSSLNKPG
jgi:hypothetical protein